MTYAPELQVPFDLSLTLPAVDEAVVELTVKSGTDTPEDLEASDEIVQIFTMAVNFQMFSDGGSGTIAQASLLDSDFDPRLRAWKYVFKMRGVPHRSLAVLVALLAQTRHSGDPVSSVTIRPQEGLAREVGVERLIKELANGAMPRPHLPFDVEWADSALGSRALMFTFEFATPLGRQVVEGLERALNVWDHLVFFGGFKFDFTWNEDFFPRVGRTAHLLPTLITHSLDDFAAPPFALNCVFNWAAAVHHQGYRLTRVALE
jgi:hypothetical protein